MEKLKTMMKLALPNAGPVQTDQTNIKIVKKEDGKDELVEYQKKYQKEVAQRVKLEDQVERYQNMEQTVKLLQEGMVKETENANHFERELKRMTVMYESEIQKKSVVEVKYYKLVRQTAVLLNFVEHLKHETQLLYRMVTIDLKDKKGEENQRLQKEFMEIEKYIMVSNVDFRKNFFGGTEQADEFYKQALTVLGTLEKDQQKIGELERKIQQEEEDEAELQEQWDMVDAPPARYVTIQLPKKG